MRTARKLLGSWIFFATIVFLLGWSSVLPTHVEAQQGDNAVCNSSSPPSGIKCSPAFIDASVITGSPNNDLCGKIYAILSPMAYPAGGTVIDARGITGAALTCQSGFTPWNNGTTFQNKPSVILLPTGTINISTFWVLPGRTRIKGMGVDGPNGTQINPVSLSPGAIIQFGPGPSYTFGISVEDLTLNGNSTTGLVGILNLYSQEQTYVSHVNFSGFTSTALQVGQSGSTLAQNSGPYENLYITGGLGPCAQIIGAGTRGIHGMTCSPAAGPQPVGLLLDSGGNTIEDVHFEAFEDGILVGSQANAASNVISNVSGSSTGAGSMTNVIHISNANVVTDLSIMGVRAISNGYMQPATIQDNVTGTTLTGATLGMYALGEVVAYSGGGLPGYSRFTTDPGQPNWGVGNFTPSSTPTCRTGSLFTNTGGSSHTTLYVCEAGVWTGK